MKDPVRLSKLMSERGVCSRREADRLIEKGWVLVNGSVIDQLGTRVSPDSHIELAPQAQKAQARKVTILLNKPVGFVSTQPEKDYQEAKVLITPENHDRRGSDLRLERHHMPKLAVVGRLDIDSKGLLVFTQDGRLAKKIIGENSEIEKEYRVWVRGELSPENLERLRHGLCLDGKALKPAKVRWAKPGELRFVLREGKKWQIRRMCELVGLKVLGLQRIRVGKVRLGDLKEGCWRFLRDDESF